jgi:bifunctional DNA-binding transcriptional regulator/antitoxin component of YhaV-PrlF toxin-antitoxin module
MLLRIDAKRRITIPPNAGIKSGDTVELDILPDGRMLLVPMAIIPRHQLCAWSRKNRKAVADSLSDPRPSLVVETAKDAEQLEKRWTI